MREIEIPLPPDVDFQTVEQAIDTAIAIQGLGVSLRGSLKKFPGCTHWHAKNGRLPGTLEIMLWPQGRRSWFTVQDGRNADWIDGKMHSLAETIQQQLTGSQT